MSMHLRTLIGKLRKSLGLDQTKGKPARRKKAGARPEIETLEDRTVPSTFGIVKGVAFLDANNNGTLDTREARLPGVKITLTGTSTGAVANSNADAGDNTSISETVITNAQGAFSFSNVPQGNYKLQTSAVPGITKGQAQTFTGVTIATNGQVFQHNFAFKGGVVAQAFSMRALRTNSTAANLPFNSAGAGAGIANHVPTVSPAISPVNTTSTSANSVINLAGNFKDADFSNSQVTFHFTNGTTTSAVKLTLFDTQAPKTVANFLDYVTANKYDDSIIHRNAKLSDGGGLGVLQGGALAFANAAGTDLNDITVFPTGSKVPNEFKAANSNKVGTIAMAQSGGDINSATNQFFFNTANNAAALDSQKFTVFGKITDDSMAALTALAATGVKNLTSTTPGSFAMNHPTALLNAVPLTNYNGNASTFATDASAANYMRITDITVDRRDDFLTYTLEGANGGGDTQIALASVSNEYITIDPISAGTTTFKIKATDRYGSSVIGTMTVTVTGNHAPVASNGTLTTNEDSNASGTLTATDADAGNTLTFTIESQPAKGSVTITNTATGAYTFNPGTAFQNLPQGGSETVTFSFKATDNLGVSSLIRTVSVTVSGVNDTPVGADASVSTDQNTVHVGTLTATDVDNGSSIASFAIVTPPSSGTATVTNPATGAFTFDPGTAFKSLGQGASSQVTFTYKATDNLGADGLPKTITVTVTGVNDVPIANDGTLAAAASGRTSGTLTGSDPDAGDTITYSIVSQPAKGSVTLDDATTGAYTFDALTDFASLSAGQSEDVVFTFKTTDNHGADSIFKTITVTVTA